MDSRIQIKSWVEGLDAIIESLTSTGSSFPSVSTVKARQVGCEGALDTESNVDENSTFDDEDAQSVTTAITIGTTTTDVVFDATLQSAGREYTEVDVEDSVAKIAPQVSQIQFLEILDDHKIPRKSEWMKWYGPVFYLVPGD